MEENKQQDSEQKPDVLLSTIKERFSANLEETKHSIIFLSVIQENGMEVSVIGIFKKKYFFNSGVWVY